MSNQTFGVPQAEEQPDLHCIGRVQEILKATSPAEGKIYNVLHIQLEGYGASPSHRVFFCWHPEWLSPDYDPNSLEEYGDEGKKMLFTYRTNIAAMGSYSLIDGLCGCDKDVVSELATDLFALSDEEKNDPNVVAEVFKRHLIDEGKGAKIGYTLTQQRVKTDKVDENGKNIYHRTQYKDVKYWWPVTEKRMNQIRRSAEKSGGKALVLFEDTDVPF